MSYEIKIAKYAFNCPVTGKRIYKGDMYAESEGSAFHLDVVLKSKEKPITKPNKKAK